MKYKFVFVGINYKTPEETIRWIKSIDSNISNGIIVIADNSAEYNPMLSVEIEKINCNKENSIVYLNTSDNLGYFNGAEYAYQFIRNSKIAFDWFIVSNVDIELKTNYIDSILDKYTECGIIAPKIESVISGIDKNPYRIERTSYNQMITKKIVFSNYMIANLYSILSNIRNNYINKKKNTNVFTEGTKMYMPYGACLFFSSKYFVKGGKIKYPLFLFGEEMYVAEQCMSLGLDIKYVPSIKFINYEHASTSKLTSKFVIKCNYEAISYILKHFY